MIGDKNMNLNKYTFGENADYDVDYDGDMLISNEADDGWKRMPRNVLLIIKGTYKKNGDSFTYVNGLKDKDGNVITEADFNESDLKTDEKFVFEPSDNDKYYARKYIEYSLIESGDLPSKTIEAKAFGDTLVVDMITYYEKFLGKGNVIYKERKRPNGEYVKQLDQDAMEKAGAIKLYDFINERFSIDDFIFELDGWRYSLTNDEIKNIRNK